MIMLKKLNNNIIFLPLLSMILCLSACTVANPRLSNANNDAIEKALKSDIIASKKYTRKTQVNMPDAVKKALMPDLSLPNAAPQMSTDQQRFNITVNNVPVNNFFMGLVKGTKYNMTVSPQVTGMISLDLKNVTIPEIMDTVRETYGFEYEQTPSGFRVFPRQLETRIFTVNYLDIERGGQSSTSFGSGELTRTTSQYTSSNISSSARQQETSPSGNVATTSNAKFWKELKENLIAIIGDKEGKSVVVNPQSGVVIVHAFTDELRNVATYLDDIQNNMNRQVVIEAQIIEVQLNAAFQTGINWKFLKASQGAYFSSSATNPAIEQIPNIPNDFSSIFTATATGGGDFQAIIQLLNTQGKANVLSSPRIATTNNQKAVIKVGGDRFFVTDVSSSTTTGTSTETSQDVTLTPFFSGIALDVTPQINENGEVTLHIHPVISKVTLDRQVFQVNDKKQDLPLAQSSIREADSVVRAKNGQIIIIGGLMQSQSSDYTASTPGTEHLGIFKNLFRSTNKSAQKFELVILLRPVVTGSNYNWTPSLQREAEKIKDMKGDFSYSIVKAGNSK